MPIAMERTNLGLMEGNPIQVNQASATCNVRILALDIQRVSYKHLHIDTWQILARWNASCPSQRTNVPTSRNWQPPPEPRRKEVRDFVCGRIEKLLGNYAKPPWELTSPTLGEGKSSTQKWFLMGYLSSLNSGIFHTIFCQGTQKKT